jgi:hypothetical protein
VARTIFDDGQRYAALAAIAERLAAADPLNPALIDQARTVARTILDESQRSDALSRIHALTRTGMLDELSRWRLRPLRDSVDLLTVFLGILMTRRLPKALVLPSWRWQ